MVTNNGPMTLIKYPIVHVVNKYNFEHIVIICKLDG
jgi:hypothetical protein